MYLSNNVPKILEALKYPWYFIIPYKTRAFLRVHLVLIFCMLGSVKWNA